jgi:uncharacterized protein (TIGR02284 family)
MEMDTINHVEATVTNLIEVCHDGRRGFEAAAEAMSGGPLKVELQRYSRQCGEFITDLEYQLRRLGQTAPTHGTIKGVPRRGWMHLAAVITRGDQAAILRACLRGQEAAVDAYEKALKESLPGELQELIAAQQRVAAGIWSRIQTLCDGLKTS